MFLHELSRTVARTWRYRVDGEDYRKLVLQWFENNCPYCSRPLAEPHCIVEHLDGMNRYRAGLHVAGNVLVACKRCNSEKRRDDSLERLLLADSGWASFLAHDGTRCQERCQTCSYWRSIWTDELERKAKLAGNSERIRSFRGAFPEFEAILPAIREALPDALRKLYSDCQAFAQHEIRTLLAAIDTITSNAETEKSGAVGDGQTANGGSPRL